MHYGAVYIELYGDSTAAVQQYSYVSSCYRGVLQMVISRFAKKVYTAPLRRQI